MTSPAPGLVLLVEDDPDHAELVERAVGECAPGVEVRRVGDGEDALRELGRLGPSPGRAVLVLLDLRLPGMDGAEVLRRIRGDVRTREIPVVLITTAEPSDPPHAAPDPGTKRVVKPIDGRRFRRLIVEVVGRWLGESGGRRPDGVPAEVSPSSSV